MQVEVHFAQAEIAEEVMKHADDRVGPLSGVHGLIDQVIDLLSKFILLSVCKSTSVFYLNPTCLGIASQHIPKIAHLQGVRKYIGPGCCGSQG